MKTKNPEVRIYNSFLAYKNISVPLAEKRGIELHSEDEVAERVQGYREAWSSLQDTILCGMRECFELDFYKSVIDACVTPAVRPQSTPLLLNTRHDPDELVDVLTHELFHVLLTDNTTYPSTRKLSEVWDRLYPGVERLVRNHIWVHAGLKYIYLNVLGEEYRLQRDIEDCKKRGSWAYVKAWEIVEEVGYKKLIDDFKATYPELQRGN